MAKINKFRNSDSNPFLLNHHEITPKSTISEWYLDAKKQYELSQSRGISAERILKLSDKMRDSVTEVITQNKKETERRLEARISDVNQATIELQNVSTILQLELETLQLLKERIRDGIKMIKEKAAIITAKCILLRERRQGIDLSQDEVEKELEIERAKITDGEETLSKYFKEIEETMRILRGALYVIKKDIDDKGKALSIEYDCLKMKETSLGSTNYHGKMPIDLSNVTVEDWARYTGDIMNSGWKKINTARLLAVAAKGALREIIEGLREQCKNVNEAFQRRISEVKNAKAKMQLQHYEITRQVNEMIQNISELKASIKQKEAFLALAQTRLEKRSNRQGIELVKDEVEATLIKEVVEIKQLIIQLQKMEVEAQISLRTLMKTQVQLEEAINIKNNSLKIDEVDCMSLRQRIEYHDI